MSNERTRDIRDACNKFLEKKGLLMDYRQAHDQMMKTRMKKKRKSLAEKAAEELEANTEEG